MPRIYSEAAPAYWEKSEPVRSNTQRRVGSLRTFGVELEVSHAPEHTGLHGNTPFGAKDDGSVHDAGMEFVSPILSGDEGLEAVENFLEYAVSNRWDCDDSCGFHVHIGVGDLSDEKRLMVAQAYRDTEKFWFTQVSDDRFEGNWCDSIDSEPNAREHSCWRDFSRRLGGRYRWVNFTAFSQHGTFEIRLHEGTVDPADVLPWIRAHLRFIEKVVALPNMAAVNDMRRTSTRGQYLAVRDLIRHRGLLSYFRRRAERAGKLERLDRRRVVA